jgi:MFS family permease
LGIVSLLMDVSSEMIHSLLPVYMAAVLGVSVVLIGFLDGLAEATALIFKVFSGVISDYISRRKVLAAIGYGLSALTKPLFAIASSFGAVFFARVADRVGKGVRGAPRDALITDVTPPELRGAAFGLRQSLDTVGAFIGPLVAFALMFATTNDYRLVFWVAVIPAILALLTIFVGVDEPARPAVAAKRENPIKRSNLARLGSTFWWITAIGGLLTFARVGDAFLVLRASEAKIPVFAIPLVMVAMNGLYSLAAYPFGRLADRISNVRLLLGGVALLVVADGFLALDSDITTSLVGLGLGLVFWGLHMAATQGLLSAMVSRVAPAEMRGTAFGMFNLVSGFALLVSGVLTGWVWLAASASVAFVLSAAISVLAIALIAAKRRDIEPR